MNTLKLPGQHNGETLESAVLRLLEKNQGKDLALPHLSKDATEALYAFGYSFYESGNYEKAMHFFRFLTLVDIGTKKHWMGLGSSYQMLKNYERALQCYAQAAMLDKSDPYVHWHAGECFLSLKNNEAAQEAFSSAELTAKKQPKRFAPLLNRLSLLKRESGQKNPLKSI